MEKLLVLEGKNDKHVVFHFCGNNESLGNIDDVKEAKSKDQLLKTLSTIIKSNPKKRIGIIIDADTEHHGTWESIRSTLLQIDLGYDVPRDFPSSGLILKNLENPDYPIFGAWIMPDNKTDGTLEHFLSFLVSESDKPLLDHARKSIAEIKEVSPSHKINGLNRLAKAEMHTFLSWQKDPGEPLGVALSKKYLDPNCEEAKGFVNWLREVFFSDL